MQNYWLFLYTEKTFYFQTKVQLNFSHANNCLFQRVDFTPQRSSDVILNDILMLLAAMLKVF